ncbi:hypothetical protein [Streptomyces sp. NPDC060049]|uniref:hypothetical protein n=1 Tax=Streptomyces sp. NPDC060049 TaxID=3347046 RepID=UPI0036853310
MITRTTRTTRIPVVTRTTRIPVIARTTGIPVIARTTRVFGVVRLVVVARLVRVARVVRVVRVLGMARVLLLVSGSGREVGAAVAEGRVEGPHHRHRVPAGVDGCVHGCLEGVPGQQAR